jgi:hypothetical protein
MIVFFNSLERVVIFSLSGVLSLMLFDMLIYIPVLRDRLESELIRKLSGRISSAFFLFLFVWKLSPLILRFGQVIARPILILYAPGGVAGGLFAAALALAYIAPILPASRQMWREIRGGKLSQIAVALVMALALFFAVWTGAGALFDAWNASRLNPGFLQPGAL